MSAMNFTPQQEMAITNRGGALLVSAAAGSGKTRVLVERLLRQVLDVSNPCDIDRFLVITFTKAAAAELRGRILSDLQRLSAAQPQNRHLRRQISLCCRAQISTIHSFCGTLLREYAYLINLSPDFRVADEQESKLLREHVATDVLEALYADLENNPGFGELVDAVSSGRDDGKLVSLVLETHEKLRSHPYPEAWAKKQAEAFETEGVTDASQTVWGTLLLRRAKRRAAYWGGRLHDLLLRVREDEAFYKAYGPSLEESVASVQGFADALEQGWDAAASFGEISFPRPKPAKGDYQAWKNERDFCKKALKKLTAQFAADSSVLLSDLKTAAPMVRQLLELTLRFDAAYTAEKRKRNLLDFSDQEHLAVQLLVDPVTQGPTPTAVEVSHRFREVMIDEYQDVNAVQDLIFRAVSRKEENLFLVGDVKQSIYRFRLADPTIFLSRYADYADAENAGPGEGRKVLLSTNFRSHPGVLDAVNFFFKNLMSETVGEMNYTPREYLYAGTNPPAGCGAPMELCLVEGGDHGVRAEAAFAARRIRELLESGQVSDGAGGLRPVRPGDVAILMRSPSSRLPIYAAALEAEGIPVERGQQEAFFQTEEISVALSILTIADNPCQDVPLVSAMMSPVWGFTADEMTSIRLADPKGDVWSAVNARAREDAHCQTFLQELSALREQVPELSADGFLWHLYTVTALPALMGAMPGGPLRRRNLMRLFELAHGYEAAGYKGLSRFIRYVRELMEKGREPESEAESVQDAVHIMSIHKSKGLEFPVVLLCDTAHRFNTEDTRRAMLIHPDLGIGPMCTELHQHTQRTTLARMAVERTLHLEMLSEEMRVLYVGLTRAREKLIVTCLRKDPQKEVEKLCGLVSLPVPPEVLEDASSVSDWILAAALCRTDCGVLRLGSTPAISVTDENVWQARYIPLTEAGGERGTEAAPEAETASAAPVADGSATRELLSFLYPHAGAESLPSKVTATELKGRFPEREAAEEAQMLPQLSPEPVLREPSFVPKTRLTAAEAGTAQHLVMQYCDFEACTTTAGAAAEVQRLLSLGVLTKLQAEAVRPEKIAAFFTSDLGQRVLQAEKCHRELKFSLLVPAETWYPGAGEEEILLQGVVDCCFEEDGKLVILDFKTDHVNHDTVSQRAQSYAGQLDAYADAMERMLGLPVKEKLLYFFALSDWVPV